MFQELFLKMVLVNNTNCVWYHNRTLNTFPFLVYLLKCIYSSHHQCDCICKLWIIQSHCVFGILCFFLAPAQLGSNNGQLILQFVTFLPSFLGLFALFQHRGPNQTKLRRDSVHLQGGARHEKNNAIDSSFQGHIQTHSFNLTLGGGDLLAISPMEHLFPSYNQTRSLRPDLFSAAPQPWLCITPI